MNNNYINKFLEKKDKLRNIYIITVNDNFNYTNLNNDKFNKNKNFLFKNNLFIRKRDEY